MRPATVTYEEKRPVGRPRLVRSVGTFNGTAEVLFLSDDQDPDNTMIDIGGGMIVPLQQLLEDLD